ncbi:MAG: Ig-like domain-containing protein, partial [Calditrichia bacterium]
AKLFETEEDPPAPEVSEIFTSLSNSRILAGDSTEFWVEASNPGSGSLHYDWNATDGYFLSPWDTEHIKWRAPFQGGIETIEIRVSNDDETIHKSKDITVVSLDTPVVNILSPKNDAYLVQFETIELVAEAFHDNQISVVEFFVNDKSIEILGREESNQYKVSWLNEALAGNAEIKVTAVASITGIMGIDSITVNIEGVIPGKK